MCKCNITSNISGMLWLDAVDKVMRKKYMFPVNNTPNRA